jgi:uncharacterized protein
LVRTIAESRATKFEHRVRDVLNLRRDEVAVICLLLLRGPQTSAELRARTERMYAFEDNAAVMTTLERLAGREVSGMAEPLTQLLARQPGAREARWVHLLSGPVSEVAVASSSPSAQPRSAGVAAVEAGGASLMQRIEALEEMVFSLEQRLFALEKAAEDGREEQG